MNTEIKMTEINKNLPSFEKRIEKLPPAEDKKIDTQAVHQENRQNIVPDTGILGRSQVVRNDIAKSVDEAVALAKSNPALLESSCSIFDILYEQFLEEGMDSNEAYMKAIEAEEEFLAIAR